MRIPKPIRLLAALLLLLIAPAALAQPLDFDRVDPNDYAFDHWFLDHVNGQPSGYYHSWLEVRGDFIYSGYEDFGVEAHDGQLMESRSRVLWVETIDFQPVSVTLEQSAGTETLTQTYTFTEQGVQLVSEQAGRETSRLLPPVRGEFLSPAQQEIASAYHAERGDEAFEFSALDPNLGMVPYVTRFERRDGAEAFELADGTEVQTTVWVATYSVVPGVETLLYMDDNNDPVGFYYEFSGVEALSRLADESVTEMDFDPPELAFLSVVEPDRPIRNVERQRQIVYELTFEAGEGVMPIQTAHQTVEEIEPGRVRVTVDLDARRPTAEDDGPTEAQLEASLRIDHEDELIRSLSRRAVGKTRGNTSQEEIARRCDEFVTDYLTGLTLAVGDATASEAARTRSGDCTECSVLLAALLRAQGIPSRCVTGLAYAEDEFAGQENVFVYHMWTQAWVEDAEGNGRWIDLDAALWHYTAGHIALGVTNMGDNDQQDNIALIQMMQELEISVRETSR